MKYEQLAKNIVDHVGGKENVNSVVHCITRLRFKLKDESKANTEALKDMNDVVTVMKSAGQYQVVIGNQVPDVYKAVVEVGGFGEPTAHDEADKVDDDNQGVWSRLIDLISGIFTPILGVLAATGMIKGLNALFVALGWLVQESGTYQILNAVGDSLFYFLPVFLGYTAIKKFGGSTFIGMAIGASLVYPALAGLSQGDPLYTLFVGTPFESPIHITFLGIPVVLMSYSSSVIPVILASYFGAKLENVLRKVIPDVVKTFLVPFFTLLITVPLAFLVIGPVATWASQLLGQSLVLIYELSPIVAGVLIGGLWQVMVIFGLHWSVVAIGINNMATLGYDPILASSFAASFAQIGAVLAVWLATRQQKLKTLSAPAFISGIFGITEPAIYGITLPLKKPFIMSCIAAGIGGGILGGFRSLSYTMGGLGVFGYPNRIHPTEGLNLGFWAAVAATLLAFAIGFALTYFFGDVREKEQETPVTKEEGALAIEGVGVVGEENTVLVRDNVQKIETAASLDVESILSPIEGEVISLSDVEDAAFSSESLGKGVAVRPVQGTIVAPVDGEVTTLFPTNHAVGITSESGAEVLIHIGMDTVQLDGVHFTNYVEQGEVVKKGQPLIEFNIEEIEKAGFSTITPIVVTNSDQYSNIGFTNSSIVKFGDRLIELK